MRIPTADLGGQHADAGGQAYPQGAQPGAPTLWVCSLAAGASPSIALHPGRCSVQLVSCCSAAIALDKDALWVGAPMLCLLQHLQSAQHSTSQARSAAA